VGPKGRTPEMMLAPELESRHLNEAMHLMQSERGGTDQAPQGCLTAQPTHDAGGTLCAVQVP